MKRSELEGKVKSLKQAISTEKSSDKIQELTDQLHSYEKRIRVLDKKKNAKKENKKIIRVPLENSKGLSVEELIRNDFDLDKVLGTTKKIKVLATYTLTRDVEVPIDFDEKHFDIRKYWKRHLSHKEINHLLMSLKDVSLTVK